MRLLFVSSLLIVGLAVSVRATALDDDLGKLLKKDKDDYEDDDYYDDDYLPAYGEYRSDVT